MDEIQKVGFLDLLKRSLIAYITPLLSAIALVLSLVQSALAHGRIIIITLLTVSTVSLIAYNIWLKVATISLTIEPSKKVPRFNKRRKLATHIASALILLSFWTVTSFVSSHKYFGYFLYNIGHYELALKHLNSFVEREKENYQALYKLSKCYEKLGNNLKYIETLEYILLDEKIIRKFKNSGRLEEELILRFEAGRALIFYGKSEGISNYLQRALTHVEKARLLDRENPIILFLFGAIRASEACIRLPNPRIYEPQINEIFRQAKESIDSAEIPQQYYVELMVKYHYWFGKSLEEIESYNSSMEELRAGLEMRERVLNAEFKPTKDSFMYHLGRVVMSKSGDLEKAREYWKDIKDLPYLVRVFTDLGMALWRKGSDVKEYDEKKAQEKFEEAEAVLSEAMKLGGNSTKLNIALGVLYFDTGDYLNAIHNWKKVTDRMPLNSTAFYMLSRSYYGIYGDAKLSESEKSTDLLFATKALDNSRLAITRAIELNPKDSNAHYWLARVLSASGDETGTVREYKESIALDKNNTEAYLNLTASIVGLSLKEDEYSDEQISLLEEALKYAIEGIASADSPSKRSFADNLKINRRMILNALAYCYADHGKNLYLARKYIDQAVNEDSNNPYFLDTKAWVLVKSAELSKDMIRTEKLHQYDKANELLTQSLNNLPTDDMNTKAETYFHLGYIKQLSKKNEMARQFYLKALEFNPEHEKAKKELDKISMGQK